MLGMLANTQELTNLQGLASRLGLPAKWLKQEAEAGRIPCLKIGAKLRFNATAVREALAVRAAREHQPCMEVVHAG
jgi:hypothetical protein